MDFRERCESIGEEMKQKLVETLVANPHSKGIKFEVEVMPTSVIYTIEIGEMGILDR